MGKRARILGVLAAITCVAWTAQARPLSTLRAFAPLLSLFGQDEDQAVAALRQNLALWNTMLRHTELEPALARLRDDVLESLGDFDLEGLHAMLPVGAGSARELRVKSRRVGQRYLLSRPGDNEAFRVCATCPRLDPGDASLSVRSQPITLPDETHYLFELKAGVAVNSIDWQDVLQAQRKWWNLLSAIDPNAAAAERPLLAYRVDARTHNPGLDAHEFEALAVLWEGFPYSGRLLRSLGRVEDLWADRSADGALHVRASLRLEPKRMAARYPELADWAEDLDALLSARLHLIDGQGRTLVALHLDSNTLRLRAEFHVRDGHFLPFDAKRVYSDAPLAFDQPQRLSIRIAADVNALGVRAHVRRIRGTLRYSPTDRGMRLHADVTQVPSIEVDGAALGFVPLELVNVFVPGDIEGLATRFATAACKGNGGKGITLDAELSRAAPGRTTVEGSLTLEALDNFFVRLGVGYWNNHLAPDEDASDDLQRLQQDALSALSSDIDSYVRARKRVGSE